MDDKSWGVMLDNTYTKLVILEFSTSINKQYYFTDFVQVLWELVTFEKIDYTCWTKCFEILLFQTSNIIVWNNSGTWKFRASRNFIVSAIYAGIKCFSGVHNVAVLWITDWKWCCILPDVVCLSQLVDTRWLCSDVMFVSEIYLK